MIPLCLWKHASHTLPSCPLIIAKCNANASEKCWWQWNLPNLISSCCAASNAEHNKFRHGSESPGVCVHRTVPLILCVNSTAATIRRRRQCGIMSPTLRDAAQPALIPGAFEAPPTSPVGRRHDPLAASYSPHISKKTPDAGMASGVRALSSLGKVRLYYS